MTFFWCSSALLSNCVVNETKFLTDNEREVKLRSGDLLGVLLGDLLGDLTIREAVGDRLVAFILVVAVVAVVVIEVEVEEDLGLILWLVFEECGRGFLRFFFNLYLAISKILFF